MDRFPFDPYDFFGYLASGLLIVAGMDIVLGFPRILGQDLKVVDTALLVLAIYIAGQLVQFPVRHSRGLDVYPGGPRRAAAVPTQAGASVWSPKLLISRG